MRSSENVDKKVQNWAGHVSFVHKKVQNWAGHVSFVHKVGRHFWPYSSVDMFYNVLFIDQLLKFIDLFYAMLSVASWAS